MKFARCPGCQASLDWQLGRLTTVRAVPLVGAGRGNRTANRVLVSSGKNDLKRLAGSGFRGFNILEDVSLSEMRLAAQVLMHNLITAGVPVGRGSSMGATPPYRVGTARV